MGWIEWKDGITCIMHRVLPISAVVWKEELGQEFRLRRNFDGWHGVRKMESGSTAQQQQHGAVRHQWAKEVNLIRVIGRTTELARLTTAKSTVTRMVNRLDRLRPRT